MKKGIDLAQWNKVTDYRALKNAGADFAILKVINKENNPDSLFHTHAAGLAGAGLPVIGGYTYSYANTVEKAKKAADAFVREGAPKKIPFMWLDLEDNSMKGLGSSIISIINVYRQAAEDGGMRFGIYTGESYYKPCLKAYEGELGDIPFWWARYPFTREYHLQNAVPDKKYLPGRINIDGWQYSSKGIVPGIKGYVDLNAWYA